METICDHQLLLQKKKTSKGKQKIPITRIIDKNSRQVTFSKRRNGLFCKCSQLSSLFPNTHFAVVTFSVGGNPFSAGSPSVDTVLNRFLEDTRYDSNSPNVTLNWWETHVDDIKLEDLERFQVDLEGLQMDVDLMVEEISHVNEPKTIPMTTNDANFSDQISDYSQQFDQPDVIDCTDYEWDYASPSPEFSDTETYDFGPIDGTFKCNNVQETDANHCLHIPQVETESFDFDWVNTSLDDIDFGCNDVERTDGNLCPKSQGETENSDFGSVNTSFGVQVSDFYPEITDIDFGCNAVQGEDANLCPKSQVETESFDFGSVNTNLGAQVSDFYPDIDFGCDDVGGIDANLCPKSQVETERFDFGSGNTSLGAQDFCPEIGDIDFGCDDESFSLDFFDNSDKRRMSYDLTEILKNVECIDASRADDSYLLQALGCC